MQVKRILPCLDIKDGKVSVGQQFKNVLPVANPVDLAKYYDSSGADELVIYDIGASMEGRQIFSQMIDDIQAVTTLPLIFGGGIATVGDVENALIKGACKVSINSGAIKDTTLIKEAAKNFGGDKIILSIDIRKVGGIYHVFSTAGQVDTGLDALAWAKKAEADGVGELVLNSIATDGEKSGFDIKLLQDFSAAVSVPIVASGGAGSQEDFLTLFTEIPTIAAGLAASVFHFKEIAIPELKDYLRKNNIPVSN